MTSEPAPRPHIRIIFTADTHLGFDDAARRRVERRRRGDDFVANYERVLSCVVATRPDVFVHGGDFFTHARPPVALVDRAYGGLLRVAEAGVPVVVVPGNHDRARLPPSLLLHHPLIHVFDRPRTVVVKARDARLALAGFPFAWGDVRSRFPGVLAQTAWDAGEADARVLCVHHAFEGATVGPADYVFRGTRDVIRPGDLPHGLAAVLSGHIHRHQVLTPAGRQPILYPGSTERTSFAERDEAKGFLDVVLAPDDGGTWGLVRASFIELPARPMIDIDVSEVAAPGVAAFLAERAGRLPADAIVRITAAAGAAGAVRGALSTATLRTIFPATVNVQLATALRGEVPTRWRRRRP